MIGCVAKALDDTLRMDGDEMDEVRWVSREAVRTAVQQSSDSDSVITGAGMAVLVPQHASCLCTALLRC